MFFKESEFWLGGKMDVICYACRYEICTKGRQVGLPYSFFNMFIEFSVQGLDNHVLI